MSRIFNTALIWLVMLAIPAQGFAASTMLFCGPMHERMAGVSAASEQSGHQHASGVTPDYQHHAASQTPDDPGKAGDLAKFSCSACAACCVGAALVASNENLPLADQTYERIISSSLPHIGFVTGGPKRPPRSILA